MGIKNVLAYTNPLILLSIPFTIGVLLGVGTYNMTKDGISVMKEIVEEKM